MTVVTERFQDGFIRRLKDQVRSRVRPDTYELLSRVYRFGRGERPLIYPSSFPCERKLKIDGVQASFVAHSRVEVNRVHNFSGERAYLERGIFPCLYSGVVVYDVGANIGTHAVFMAKKEPSSLVYAFEPDTGVTPRLRENIARNRCRNVTVLPFALSNFDGDLVVGVDPTRDMVRASQVKSIYQAENEFSSFETVSCRTIDSLVRERQVQAPNIIKIDVEGLELSVIEGLQDFRPSHVFVEVHESFGVSLGSVADYLSARGYKMASQPLPRGGQLLCHFSRP